MNTQKIDDSYNNRWIGFSARIHTGIADFYKKMPKLEINEFRRDIYSELLRDAQQSFFRQTGTITLSEYMHKITQVRVFITEKEAKKDRDWQRV